MDSMETVEKILNYSFKNKTLLKEAITLSPRFKRLEFLGDSVLEVALANYIHHAYPNLKLQELCDLRTANVNNEKFARATVKHNLYQFIIGEKSSSPSEKIKEFSEAVSKEDVPVPYGGLVEAPKVLGDIVESIAGAVYIDVDFDVQRFWEIFRGLLEPIYTLDDLQMQPKPPFLTLFRLADKHGKRIDFRYSKDDHSKENIAEVYLDGIFIASGCTKSLSVAKVLAAEEAVQKLSEYDVEIENVKRKLIEICSTEKLRLPIESFSLPTASENPVTDEMTQEQMVIDEDCPHVELEDAKRKLIDICSIEKLRLPTESFSLPAAYENPLTDEIKQVPGYPKGKLHKICVKNKWPFPIYRIEEERGPKNEQKFVCSVKIEIPNIEGSFHMKGDAKPKKKEAENSSAYHMIRALESSLMSLVINPQMPKVLDEKKNPSLVSSEMDSDSVKAVEKILNYVFTNKNLLKEALRQTSSLFQKLRFVGRAALVLAITNHIYLRYPNFEPRELELLQRGNTCNKTLARVAVKHNIHQFFIGQFKSEKKIEAFSKVVGKEDDPVPSDGRSERTTNVLSDLVESVAGAVYIDMNFDIKRLWESFRGLFEPLYTLDDLRLRPQPIHTLSCLGDKDGKHFDFRYEEKGSNRYKAHVYLDDKLIASGKKKNSRDDAKMSAAMEAVRKLSESMPVEIVMDRQDIVNEDAKDKLIEICNKRKWPNPVYSVESNGKSKGYVCSAKIETPTEEGTLYVKGDRRKLRKTAETPQPPTC
ncbi:ribonuclease 3-like protein 3 [Arabidopsis lyrata subsp. lyrata]|uniref:ribonuclease 3-like protein 3 n=1 Tax=Arabidopsis lyrata subsp. lyrata TaxID=81972 RepID=UPI000A29AD91|nr:ribonuclease 3-like protein 3 [Arabidopsis lyrata subsp. lyrata]|eukprot:XP_020888981.1 ribonuclease 3-like protein 3 [Arabidopsis lyrata subsp. lyrata]